MMNEERLNKARAGTKAKIDQKGHVVYNMATGKRRQTICLKMSGDRHVKFVTDPEKMAMTCPSWLLIRHEARRDIVQIKNVCLEHPEAEWAIQVMLEIAHGNVEIREEIKTATARQLLYVAEIYNWLGRPGSIHAPDTGPHRARCFRRSNTPFLPTEVIAKGVKNLVVQAKELCRVQNWLLLGIVAHRFGLDQVEADVKRAVYLSCRANGSSVLTIAHGFLTAGQWNTLQRIVSTEDGRMRSIKIDDIFYALELLVDQVINLEAGILPNEELFETWERNHIAPCKSCHQIPMNTLLRALIAEGLWPLCPESYQGSVNDLVGALRKGQVRMSEEASIGT
ncbi:hypothetical protein AK830_g2493 [Neonectria ditissima]|uniref:Uncharacterized protein n=1 Tax=Neonectria ditissima TaxID=78410 RepID=A0A0P7BJX5_9HYPO|nr:hypothetical protein AK830_g2493 [Neonectria ditissima]